MCNLTKNVIRQKKEFVVFLWLIVCVSFLFFNNCVKLSLFRYTLNGGIKPIPVPYISADNRSTHNLSTSSVKKVHHHQVNGGIPAGNVHATTLSRPSSRAGSRTRSRSRSKSRARSHSRPRNSRQNLNTSYGSSSHSISNGVPPSSIFPRHHQSSLSGQSHFSHTDSTGRLLVAPVQRMSRYWLHCFNILNIKLNTSNDIFKLLVLTMASN